MTKTTLTAVKDRRFAAIAEIEDDLEHLLAEAEECVVRALESRKLPQELKRLSKLAAGHVLGDLDAPVAAKAYHVLTLVGLIRDLKLSREVQSQMCLAVELGLAVNGLTHHSFPKEPSKLSKILYPLFREHVATGKGEPNVKVARQHVLESDEEFYNSQERKNPLYWKESFRITWNDDLRPRFRSRYKSEQIVR